MEIHYDEENCQFVSTEQILPSVIKAVEGNCQLCARTRKFYCCAQCSDGGGTNFLTQIPSDDGMGKIFPGAICGLIKAKILTLKEERDQLRQLEQKVQEALAMRRQRDKLITDIHVARKRNAALKQLQNIQEEEIEDLKKQRKVLESNIEQLNRRSQRVQMKKSKITEYMTTKKHLISKVSNSLSTTSTELEETRISQVEDLVTHIFPLVGISQDETYDSENSSDEEKDSDSEVNVIEEALAEARRLSFVHGRWIYDQREGPDLVRISIASSRVSAPADGNYSACEVWLKSQLTAAASEKADTTASTSAVVPHTEPHRSRGASTYAALCLATHLLHTLRKVLCLRMPYKLHYKSFSSPYITVQEFLWNVHKLNGNVLALCLHYGVDPELIHPLHTLPNIQNAIQMFLHNGDRASPCLLTPELVLSLEEALDESSDPLPDDDEEKLEESLSEWDSSLHDEDWESLVPKTSGPAQHQYMSAAPFQSQAPDDMGQSQGLMSSAFAWATKGWWGK